MIHVATVFAPALGALIVGFFGRLLGDRPSQVVTCGFMALSAIFGTISFLTIVYGGPEKVVLLEWISVGSFESEWTIRVDALTGVMFFVGAPDQYIHNPVWWAKVAFILIAGLNILAFELSPRAKALVQEVGPGDNTPLRLKLAGGVSLLSWFAVLYFGRMLPFIGNAF